ncbi:MAG: magnesium chelatase, partial [Candidatus Marinimicrobia bacterium CG_4_9_14_3_um_filter_48_9]
MLARVYSSSVLGIDPYIVEVEVNIEYQAFRYTTVGLPEAAVRESKERVISAIKNSGFRFPPKNYTVNLAPADVKKEGSAFDLAIAVGILAALGYVDYQKLQKFVMLGELALDGTLRDVKGALPISVGVRESEYGGLILPAQNAREAAITNDVEVIPVHNLLEAVQFLNNQLDIPPMVVDVEALFAEKQNYALDF